VYWLTKAFRKNGETNKLVEPNSATWNGKVAGLLRPVHLAVAALLMIWFAVHKFVVEHSFSLYDDAYIYLRYVDNVYAGCGLRFNCGGDPVEGFSSPLYLLLLVLGRLVTSDLEALTQVLGGLTLGAALSVTVLTGLRQRLLSGSVASGVVVLLGSTLVLGADHMILLNSVTGMETGLGCLTVAMVFWAALQRRPLMLGLWLVLAVLARPECLLLVLALPLMRWTRTPRLLLPLAGALLLMVLLRWIVFGDLLPNTYWAKAGGTARHLELGLEYIADAGRNFPALLLCPLALLIPAARGPVAYILAVAGLWLAFFLRSGGDTFAYSRLLMPLVPTLTLLGVAGLTAALARIGARNAERNKTPNAERGAQSSDRRWRWVRRSAVVAICLTAAVVATIRHEIPPVHGFDNVKRWKQVGLYLAQKHKGRSIATVPIGAIGYFSGLDLLDLVGLASRSVAKAGASVPPRLLGRRWIGHERHHTAHVLAREPDLIVLSKWRRRPWTDLRQTRAGFYAEWLLLRAIKEGRAPYRLHSAEVAPGMHWLMFELVR